MTLLPVTMAILFFSLILIISESSYQVHASHNPNLYVSAENLIFDNHFSGSMVVEVVVNDPNLLDTDEGKGEPDVSLNGKQLRMVQASDGKWYAYFANLQKAKIADQTSFDGGVSGVGLDFGVFCSRDTTQLVFGASFSDTDGIAVPRSIGISGFTNGISSFSSCSGLPAPSSSLNNVVRESKSINTNSAVLPGQIGLDPNAWPIIQLFSFDDVVIQYNRAGGPQKVELEYDEIPNVLLNLDRTSYPKNAEVFVSVNDFQLNQDPTDEDSWTFNVASPQATFYQAFDENGANSANGGLGLVNLISRLSSLGFEDNGKLTLSLNNVAELKSNDEQPSTSVFDGTNTFTQIVTLVESRPNSGVFENFDDSDQSNIGILVSAPRGQSATIQYNAVSSSILSGTFTAPEPAPAPEPASLPSISEEPVKEKVPGWIKNNAKWWAEGQIQDKDFVGGIEFMIKNKIINSPELSGVPDTQESKEDVIETKHLTVNAKEFVRPQTRGVTDTVVIKGYFEDYDRGGTIQMIIEFPDGKTEEQKFYASKGEYNTIYLIDRDAQLGEYKITTFYKDAKDMITLKITDGTDSQQSKSDESKTSSKVPTESIPDWIRNNAGWWADGLISEDDFVAGIKWLVENGIIKV